MARGDDAARLTLDRTQPISFTEEELARIFAWAVRNPRDVADITLGEVQDAIRDAIVDIVVGTVRNVEPKQGHRIGVQAAFGCMAHGRQW